MKQTFSGTATKTSGTTIATRSTFLTKKILLFIMPLMVISILSQTLALEITIDFPPSVNLNEEFAVSVNTDSEEIHDVKIFVHDSEDDKIKSGEYISEIYNDGWKNSWYYLKGIFPDKTEYKVRVIESPGKRKLCVRLRKTNTKTFHTKCKSIIIQKKEFQETQKEQEPNREPEVSVQKTKKTSNPQIPLSAEKQNPSEKIFLNSPLEKKESQKILITKTEKTRLRIVYAFTFFCILIIVLLALRKL